MEPDLNYISTRWTEIETKQQNGDLRELADYLATRYFQPLAEVFRKRRSHLDKTGAFEMASEVFYELLQNDYAGLKRLNRERGHLRGLFYKIARAKLSKLEKKEESLEEQEEPEIAESQKEIEIFLDIHGALKRLEEEKPSLYEPFYRYYMGGEDISSIRRAMELNEPNIRKRIQRAKLFLESCLPDYK